MDIPNSSEFNNNTINSEDSKSEPERGGVRSRRYVSPNCVGNKMKLCGNFAAKLEERFANVHDHKKSQRETSISPRHRTRIFAVKASAKLRNGDSSTSLRVPLSDLHREDNEFDDLLGWRTMHRSTVSLFAASFSSAVVKISTGLYIFHYDDVGVLWDSV
jgi:hypothetical protein